MTCYSNLSFVKFCQEQPSRLSLPLHRKHLTAAPLTSAATGLGHGPKICQMRSATWVGTNTSTPALLARFKIIKPKQTFVQAIVLWRTNMGSCRTVCVKPTHQVGEEAHTRTQATQTKQHTQHTQESCAKGDTMRFRMLFTPMHIWYIVPPTSFNLLD